MPLTVTFANSSTNATNYLWHFGDGVTSTLFSPTHSYSSAGIYAVSLTATNDQNATSSATRLITVAETDIACQLYAVYDVDSIDTQFFTIDMASPATEISPYGPEYQGTDIEALDIHPQTRQLYAVKSYNNAQDSELYLLDPLSGVLTFINNIHSENGVAFREVDALSFTPNGTLWGFAKEGDASQQGLITIDSSTGLATLQVQSDQDITALAWTATGNKLWLAVNKDLYSYTLGGAITYQRTLSELPGQIEGLEFRPDGLLLAGLHLEGEADELLNVYAIDIENDLILFSESLNTHSLNDVESMAWPKWCSPPTITPLLDLIEVRDNWRYFKGTTAPAATWAEVGFDAATWLNGSSGFGYDQADDYTPATLLNDMAGNYVSLFARKVFILSEPLATPTLLLQIDYDDGFIAYLNGTPVLTQGLSNAAFDTVASSLHEAETSSVYDLSTFSHLLRLGPNVLAVQGHNQSPPVPTFF